MSARARATDYDDPTRLGGPDRDNDGYDLVLGLNRVIRELWIIDAALGYAPRDYADPALAPVSGGDALTLNARLTWNPTPLTSLIAELDRRSFETDETGAAALLDTTAELRVEHQLWRRLILDAGIGRTRSDFIGSERRDDDAFYDLGLSYALTKLINVRAAWSARARDSTYDTQIYDKNVASLQLRVNY